MMNLKLTTEFKIYLQAIGANGLDRIDLAENNNKWRAVVNTVMKFGELLE
jgi:hypothetical protein